MSTKKCNQQQHRAHEPAKRVPAPLSPVKSPIYVLIRRPERGFNRHIA